MHPIPPASYACQWNMGQSSHDTVTASESARQIAAWQNPSVSKLGATLANCQCSTASGHGCCSVTCRRGARLNPSNLNAGIRTRFEHCDPCSGVQWGLALCGPRRPPLPMECIPPSLTNRLQVRCGATAKHRSSRHNAQVN